MSADRRMIRDASREHSRIWRGHVVQLKLRGTGDEGDPVVLLGAKCFGANDGEPCDWELMLPDVGSGVGRG